MIHYIVSSTLPPDRHEEAIGIVDDALGAHALVGHMIGFDGVGLILGVEAEPYQRAILHRRLEAAFGDLWAVRRRIQ